MVLSESNRRVETEQCGVETEFRTEEVEDESNRSRRNLASIVGKCNNSSSPGLLTDWMDSRATECEEAGRSTKAENGGTLIDS